MGTTPVITKNTLFQAKDNARYPTAAGSTEVSGVVPNPSILNGQYDSGEIAYIERPDVFTVSSTTDATDASSDKVNLVLLPTFNSS